ncbi:hypothetical protein JOE33_004427 [Pseudomonas sp. PvP027]|uniref:hypothetical protein n=1 Tax=Pseudomonas TaxID=286 RepID=UPI001B5C7E11|nr:MULTISPECIES: hypothetical protein [Pseudomonas]MBP1147504.1 hypothetical protein [Pseudomonas sp. PvP027]
MVTSVNTNGSTGATARTHSLSSTTSNSPRPPSATSNKTQDSGKLSSLSVQLSERATRAASRDASLDHDALGAKAAEQLDQIIGRRYDVNKAKNDAEMPDTTDPELLTRAKKATQFVNGGRENPFAGMSRDQLSLIAYDESGTFTVNEKKAAWVEDFNQESLWRQQFAAKAMAEYNSTGKLNNAFGESLEHFKGLPAIEKAQYPENYESKIQGWIDQDFNYLTNTAEGKSDAQDFIGKLLTRNESLFGDSASAADSPSTE